MADQAIRKLFQALDRLASIGAAVVAVVLGLTFFWIGRDERIPEILREFIKNLSVEFIAAAAVVSGSYFLFRRINEVRDGQRTTEETAQIAAAVVDKLRNTSMDAGVRLVTHFGQVEWATLIARSRRIDIVVHYLDSWIGNNLTPLGAFFANGGAVRLLLPNFTNQQLIEQIELRFDPVDQESVAGKIENTLRRFEQAAITHTARISAQYTDLPVWYSAFIFDDRELVLSPFEHTRKLQVRSPAFVIDLVVRPDVKAWITKEFTHLLDNSHALAF